MPLPFGTLFDRSPLNAPDKADFRYNGMGEQPLQERGDYLYQYGRQGGDQDFGRFRDQRSEMMRQAAAFGQMANDPRQSAALQATKLAQEQNFANALALAGSASGGAAGQASALRQAQYQQAGANQQALAQGAIARAQERQALLGMQAQITGQGAGMDSQAALAQYQLGQQGLLGMYGIGQRGALAEQAGNADYYKALFGANAANEQLNAQRDAALLGGIGTFAGAMLSPGSDIQSKTDVVPIGAGMGQSFGSASAGYDPYAGTAGAAPAMAAGQQAALPQGPSVGQRFGAAAGGGLGMLGQILGDQSQMPLYSPQYSSAGPEGYGVISDAQAKQAAYNAGMQAGAQGSNPYGPNSMGGYGPFGPQPKSNADEWYAANKSPFAPHTSAAPGEWQQRTGSVYDWSKGGQGYQAAPTLDLINNSNFAGAGMYGESARKLDMLRQRDAAANAASGGVAGRQPMAQAPTFDPISGRPVNQGPSYGPFGSGPVTSDARAKKLETENDALKQALAFAQNPGATAGAAVGRAVRPQTQTLQRLPEFGYTLVTEKQPKNELEAERMGKAWYDARKAEALQDYLRQQDYLKQVQQARAERDLAEGRHGVIAGNPDPTYVGPAKPAAVFAQPMPQSVESDERSKQQIAKLEGVIAGLTGGRYMDLDEPAAGAYPTPKQPGSVGRMPDVPAPPRFAPREEAAYRGAGGTNSLVDQAAALPNYGWRYDDQHAPQANMRNGLPPNHPFGYQQKVGPMANDMAKLPMTSGTVSKGPDGMLRVDAGQLALTDLALASEISKALKEQGARIAELEGGKKPKYPTPKQPQAESPTFDIDDPAMFWGPGF